MKQAPPSDPSYEKTISACEKILEICEPHYVGGDEGQRSSELQRAVKVGNVVAPAVLAAAVYLLNESRETGNWGDSMLPRLHDTEDVALLGLAVAAIIYLFCFAAIQFLVSGDLQQPEVAAGMRKSISCGSALMDAADILKG
jgi:hypothetical protein